MMTFKKQNHFICKCSPNLIKRISLHNIKKNKLCPVGPCFCVIYLELEGAISADVTGSSCLLFRERYAPLMSLWRIGCSGELFFALSLFFGAKAPRTGSDKDSCISKGEVVMLNSLGKLRLTVSVAIQ